MIAVSSILRRVVYPVMSWGRMFPRGIGAGEVGVLTYHGVLPVGSTPGASPIEGALLTSDQFRRHLRFLKSRYHLICPDEFHAWLTDKGSLAPRAVLLTCDDGLRNVLTGMLPILMEEDVRCLFFVTGASLGDTGGSLWYDDLYHMIEAAPGDAVLAVGGKTVRKESCSAKVLVSLWWKLVEEYSMLNSDDREGLLCSLRRDWRLPDEGRMSGDGPDARGYGLLNRRELEQLVSHGMTVGAHTLSHPLLARMPEELAEAEIRESKLRLESTLQREVWALAYPFGHKGSAGAREMTMAEKAGYSCAFLNCGGGLSRLSSPRFGLPRAHVTAHMSLPEMEAHLSGFHEALQMRVRGDGGVSPSCS